MTQDVSNSQDVIDSRDIIARIEELTAEVENIDDMPEGDQLKNTEEGAEIRAELKVLTDLTEEAEACASDWRYGATMIRKTYFEDYCREMLADCGDLPKNLPAYIVIDWAATADNLRVDYSEVDFDGVIYLIR